MSEFSESYHLRGSSRRDAVALLGRAGLAGYVFPALDGWVSLVAEGEPFKPNRRLIAANHGVLLRWVYGDDHGWEFNVFEAKKAIIKYQCTWDEEIEISGKVNLAELEQVFDSELPALAGEEGVRLFYPSSMQQLIDAKPAYAFAAAVGLTNYRWLAYDYIASDAKRGHPLPPGVQRVE